jgi:hypothetical protein
MKNISIYLLFSILTYTSCNQKQSEAFVAISSDSISQDEQNAELDKQNKILLEQQTQLQNQIDEQEKQKQQEKLAENEPVTISNFKIENCTKQGTVLNTGNLYKREDVRYIKWSADYTDNVVKAGGKTYGTLYAKYMKKSKYGDSWETFDYQGEFSEISNSYNEYTRKYNMVDDGAETGIWSESLGTETGYDFDIGKWKIELYWDKNNEGKAIFLGGDYFEIY